MRVSWCDMSWNYSCQPLLGVNLSPEFVNLYFPYAGRGLLFFCWWQWHSELQPACVAMEGRSNVLLNMHAQLQISHLKRFLSLLHYASQCAFGDGVCWLLIWQFFSLFARFKTTAKSHENYVFLYPFFSLAIPQNKDFFIFYTGKLHGLTGMWNVHYAHFEPSLLYTDNVTYSAVLKLASWCFCMLQLCKQISFLVLLHVATLLTN